MLSMELRRLWPRLLPVLLATASCAWLSCASWEFQGLGYDYRSETYLSGLPDDSTRAYWLKLYRIIEIVDDTLFRRLQFLDVDEDRATIDSLIDDFKRRKDFETRPDTPDRNEWWEEIWNVRAAHCDSFYHSPYFKDQWDLRARPVLLHGIPQMEYQSMSQCFETLSVYYQDWPKQALFLAYLGDGDIFGQLDTFACEGNVILVPQGKYLDAFVNHEEKVNPYGNISKQLEAAVDIVSFPDGDDLTLWVSSGVAVADYAPDSAKTVSFHQQATIYRLEPKPKLVFSDSTSKMTLPLPDSVNKLDDYWFPVYLGGCRLPAGSYDIYLTLHDDHAANHVGAYRTTVTLPSPRASKGMSDILITLKPAESALKVSENRIVRDNFALMGNPAYYHRGDTISPYVEFDVGDFKPSKSGQYEYAILVSIYRAKETFGKPRTEIGEVFEVSHDTVDNTPSQRLLRRPQQKSEALIYSTTRSTTEKRVSFQEQMVLPPALHSGKYLLVISAQDAFSRKFMTSWREIRIKK